MGGMRRFGTDRRGSVGILFGLATIPLLAGIGSALDYSRAANFQSHAQLAVDAAALALVREPSTATDAEIAARGETFVRNALGASLEGGRGITLTRLTATRQGRTFTVAVAGSMKSSILQVVGIPTVPVSATSTAVSATSTTKIEIALVLDNTGSMDDRIGGRRKMDELQGAARQLLTDLRALADTSDRVKASIVPFDTEVRLDAAANRAQPWFRFADESRDRPAWTGYVYDRFGSYAASDSAPSSSVRNSLFPAPRDTEYRTNAMLGRLSRGDIATLRPLTSLSAYADYQALDQTIRSMQPRGYTNIALGVMWGLATLSDGVPFTNGAPKSDAATKKYMIVLTDGKNTMNHVDGALNATESQIDAKTSAACALVKSEKVEVFTIRLLEGDETLLRNCASNAGNYFDVQTSGELSGVFNVILGAIAGTRLTH